ncbi:MAG: hypothetical protein ACYDEN_09725, partial [Acidimicrobiales bacterium]
RAASDYLTALPAGAVGRAVRAVGAWGRGVTVAVTVTVATPTGRETSASTCWQPHPRPPDLLEASTRIDGLRHPQWSSILARGQTLEA